MLLFPSEYSANNSAVNLPAANQVQLLRVHIPADHPIANFGLFVLTPDSGHYASIGIYDIDGEELLIDSGPMAIDNAGNVTGSDTSVTLQPGEYLYAVTCTSTDAQFLGQSENAELLSLLNAVGFGYGRAINSASNGQLPATLGGVIADSGGIVAGVFA